MSRTIKLLLSAVFGPEHPDIDPGRLGVLRIAFKVFGWMAIASTIFAGASWLFVSDSNVTLAQVTIYLSVALFCYFIKPMPPENLTQAIERIFQASADAWSPGQSAAHIKNQ